jgi:hypothetical protein
MMDGDHIARLKEWRRQAALAAHQAQQALAAAEAALDAALAAEATAPPAYVAQPPRQLMIKEVVAVIAKHCGRTYSYSTVRRWCLKHRLAKPTPIGGYVVDLAELMAQLRIAHP